MTHNNTIGLPVNVTIIQQRGRNDTTSVVSGAGSEIKKDNATLLTIEGLSPKTFDLTNDDSFLKALKSKNGKIDKKLIFKLP